MERVVERANVWLANQRVVRNKGAAGVDGVTVAEFKDWRAVRWPSVKKTLLEGRYLPRPVRRVDTGAPPLLDPPGYARHRPEATLLYQLVEQHYPAFRRLRAESGRPLPDYVQEEFEAYLKCGHLEQGFLRVRCEDCHADLLVAFSCKKHGFCPSCGARRMAETAAFLADEGLPERPLRRSSAR